MIINCDQEYSHILCALGVHGGKMEPFISIYMMLLLESPIDSGINMASIMYLIYGVDWLADGVIGMRK